MRISEVESEAADLHIWSDLLVLDCSFDFSVVPNVCNLGDENGADLFTLLSSHLALVGINFISQTFIKTGSNFDKKNLKVTQGRSQLTNRH